MKGREHVYWSVMSFSIFIFAFSVQQGYYDPGNFTWFALIASIVMAIIVNEIANTIESRKKTEEAQTKKKAGMGKVNKDDPAFKIKKAALSAENLLETILRIITYIGLGFVIIVCTYVGNMSSDNIYFVIWAYVCAAFGGIFPDFLDSTIPDDMRFHRDPWTHSTVFASALAAGCLLFVDYGFISLNLFAIAFLLGNTSHLLCDNFESGSTFADAFVHPLHWKECPGDIRHVAEERERSWLNSQVVMAFVLVIFISMRYSMTSDTDGVMAGIVIYESGAFIISSIATVVLSILVICYLLTLILYIAWDDKRKKPAKKTKKTLQAKQ